MRLAAGLAAILLFFCLSGPIEAYSADHYVLMEASSGRVLVESDAHRPERIASITKIMTAHLAIRNGNLDEKVKISQNAASTEGSSLYLKAGQTVTMNDLVHGLLLRSGNDAAVAIAEHIAGSTEAFSDMMNREAEEIGMKNSHFTNPHGLDHDDQHRSTAYDMALLTRRAMENKRFREVFGSKQFKAESTSPPSLWQNKHRMITHLYPFTNGGKTGFTKLAGRTLVTTAEKDGMTLIAVTLNAPDDWNDHITMFTNAFNDYELTPILSKGPLPSVPAQSPDIQYELARSFSYPLKKSEHKDILVQTRLQSGNNASVKVLLKGESIAELPITVHSSSATPSWFERVKKLFERSLP